jgi:hypothetical protein
MSFFGMNKLDTSNINEAIDKIVNSLYEKYSNVSMPLSPVDSMELSHFHKLYLVQWDCKRIWLVSQGASMSNSGERSFTS